jgi:hypothetical protein
VSRIATPVQTQRDQRATGVDSPEGFLKGYEGLDLRSNRLRWGYFQRAVGFARRLPTEPTLAKALDLQLPSDCDVLKALEHLLKKMEPQNRLGAQRASKQFCALSMLIEEKVPVEKTAEEIERRCGIGKLASAHARRHDKSNPAGAAQQRQHCRVSLPADVQDACLLLYRPATAPRRKGTTEWIGTVKGVKSADELKALLVGLAGFTAVKGDTAGPD